MVFFPLALLHRLDLPVDGGGALFELGLHGGDPAQGRIQRRQVVLFEGLGSFVQLIVPVVDLGPVGFGPFDVLGGVHPVGVSRQQRVDVGLDFVQVAGGLRDGRGLHPDGDEVSCHGRYLLSA